MSSMYERSSMQEQSARSNVDDHIRTSVLQAAVDDASQALDQENMEAATQPVGEHRKKNKAEIFGTRSKSTVVKSDKKKEKPSAGKADS